MHLDRCRSRAKCILPDVASAAYAVPSELTAQVNIPGIFVVSEAATPRTLPNVGIFSHNFLHTAKVRLKRAESLCFGHF